MTDISMEMCEKAAEEIADEGLKEWPALAVKEHHFQDTVSSSKTGECIECLGYVESESICFVKVICLWNNCWMWLIDMPTS